MLVSIPHGGLEIPGRLKSQFLPDSRYVLRDADTWAQELYSLHGEVADIIDTDIARIVLDMNRSPQDRPPGNPDGVVKTLTVAGERIWRNPDGLSSQEVNWLLDSYHRPYHAALCAAATEGDVAFGIDCHTMLPMGPACGVSPGKKRPALCISNRGNGKGEPVAGPVTMPPGMFMALGEALAAKFCHEDVEISRGIERVGRNEPCQGGYIIQNHGINGRIPWVQLEINRSLYLPVDLGGKLQPDIRTARRIEDVRRKLVQALRTMF